MTYISIQELAKHWNISQRQAARLCNEGKVPGAFKDGREWRIPADVERPADGRMREVRASGAVAQGGQKGESPTREKRKLPVGISSYRDVVENYYYVDKTLFIRDLLQEKSGVFLFTRPRRFGKSLNMDMLKTFFEQSAEDTSVYFREMAIWECGPEYRKHQGTYPVISLTFRNGKRNTWEAMLGYIARTLGNEFLRHPELKGSEKCTSMDLRYYEKVTAEEATEDELMDALEVLSRMLYAHHGVEPVILIDEYDVPIQQGWLFDFYDTCVSFMRSLFTGGLKDNHCLSFGILTGVLRVAKESMFSGLNNLRVNTILDTEYSEYFGFTPEEVSELAAYYEANDKIPELQDWYDGYTFGAREMYNPWSVSNYFRENCTPRAYWVSTSSNELLGDLLRYSTRSDFRKLNSLLDGESIVTKVDTDVAFSELRSNRSVMYSFLLLSGYLKALDSTAAADGDAMCHAAIPNKEVLTVFRKEILERVSREHIISSEFTSGIGEALFEGDTEGLAFLLEEMLLETASYFDVSREDFYHGFVLGLCALLREQYVVRSNREAGTGRYDIQLEPRSGAWPGILIELKATTDEATGEQLAALAKEAVQQISEKQYDTELLSRGVSPIYKYGVAFHGKQVVVEADLPQN